MRTEEEEAAAAADDDDAFALLPAGAVLPRDCACLEVSIGVEDAAADAFASLPAGAVLPYVEAAAAAAAFLSRDGASLEVSTGVYAGAVAAADGAALALLPTGTLLTREGIQPFLMNSSV